LYQNGGAKARAELGDVSDALSVFGGSGGGTAVAGLVMPRVKFARMAEAGK
jgi:hypothetical protein